MQQLGLIDETALAKEQFELITSWMEGNHPEYASIMDDVDALTREHDKIELFFLHGNLAVSADNLRNHATDLKDWLRKTEEEIEQSTSYLFEEKLSNPSCGCKKKGKAKRKACCCQQRQWLLWLALAAILLIFMNLKQYVVAGIFAIAVLVIAKPKLLQDVL